MEIPIYEAFLNDKNQDEIRLISFVTRPAIERNFIAMQDEKEYTYFSEDLQEVISPVLIPDKLIFRSNESGNFYTRFSVDTIKQIVYQYSKNNNQNNSNLNHKLKLDGIVMLESWIKESDVDKSSQYGFSDLPVGTWFVKYKVDNQTLWSDIKEGNINGLSVEGFISYKDTKEIVKLQEEKKYTAIDTKQKINIIFNKVELVANPQAGETRDEFLSRCIPLEMGKGHPQDQAIAICEVTYTNK